MHIFIITSVLKPKMGILSNETRHQQTIKTIESIRKKAPGSLILMIDSSPVEIEPEITKEFSSKVEYFVSLSNHQHAIECANRGLKSPGELYIMVVALDIIRNLTLTGVQRVFKITGRGELTDRFDISDYEFNPEMKNKYVFKKAVKSWMHPDLKLVDTRLWSFDYTMLDEVDKMVREAFTECMATGWDIEHVYYKLIEDKDRIFEKDVIGMKCQLASTGDIIDE